MKVGPCKIITYRGFTGEYQFNGVEFHGRILDIDEYITFETDFEFDIEREFRLAVNKYVRRKR